MIKKSNTVAKKIQEKVKENTKERIYTWYNKAQKPENWALQNQADFGYIFINNVLTHFAVSDFNDALYKEQVIIVTGEKLTNLKAVWFWICTSVGS